MLGCSQQHVRTMVRDGLLKGEKAGILRKSPWRINRASVYEFVEKHTDATAADL